MPYGFNDDKSKYDIDGILTALENALTARTNLGSTNWNNVKQTGVYRTDSISNNGPSGAVQWGLLVVIGDANITNPYIRQIYFPNFGGVIYYTRSYFNNAWQSWTHPQGGNIVNGQAASLLQV